MTSSRSSRLTPEADDDLAAILQYTLENWGQEQHDTYQLRIAQSIQRLVEFPGLGRSRDEIHIGLRSHPVGEHVLYYSAAEEVLTVVRILHRRSRFRSRSR